MHLTCFAVFWVGYSAVAIGIAVFTYFFRIFCIGAFYHRYFSHRAFKTSRIAQFIFAALAGCSVQRGPLWWAAHHRLHHMESDQAGDSHSPQQNSFMWSHMGWFLCRKNFGYPEERIQDFAQYPELRFLDRYDVVMPLIFALLLFSLGSLLAHIAPHLHTNGWQVLIWGFFISTVLIFHVTFSVNSFAHLFGRRPYNTKDSSGNLPILALLTFGEGWHNNHHHYPKTARQGFQWWEIDITYYLIQLMARLGIVWDVKTVPVHIKKRLEAPTLQPTTIAEESV